MLTIRFQEVLLENSRKKNLPLEKGKRKGAASMMIQKRWPSFFAAKKGSTWGFAKEGRGWRSISIVKENGSLWF